MSASTITSKGQTTIPQKIRQYLDLHTGDQLEFLIDPSGKVFITPLTTDVKLLKGFFPKPKKKVTIKQMNEAIAKRGADS